MIRTGFTALLTACLLTACAQPAPSPGPAPSSAPARQHQLLVEVTGTATISSLVFTLDGQTTEEKDVTPPWRKEVAVPYGTGRHEWKLTMRHSGGTLSATGSVDGKLVTRTGGASSGGTTNTASLTGSFTD
ncbi:hypothetical protein [Kibdelosporangium persicum]|uniref:hypothetical protein n=1 Tax=Kibdelosporangium persicum TaxID=2698649 RepID=UPI001566B258|nr:hypothetical protein [Kibdelosporangium persicum]